MAVVTQLHSLAPDTRARAGMAADYFDSFVVISESVRGRSAPECAHAVGVAAGLGGQLIWRGLLQLQLNGDRGPGGWTTVDEGPGWVTLEARSWALTARIVVEVQEDELSGTLLIRYDRTVGRLIWTPLSAVHRRLMPGLLRMTVRVLRAESRQAS